MKVDLRLLPIHAFTGEDEGMDSLTLAQVFSSGGSFNVWMDSYGRVSVIAGYRRRTLTPVTSHDGGNPTSISSLYHYVNQSKAGGIIRQLVGFFPDAGTHNDFYYSSDGGATWTWVYDSSSGNNSNHTIADYAALGDQLVIVNGVNNTKVWDGTTLTTIYLTQQGPPHVAVGVAGQPKGHYQFRILPILGTGKRKRASEPSDPILLVHQTADLTWSATDDTQVKSYEIYATTGTGKVFYFAGATDTLAFTFDIADLDLIQNRAMEEHGDPPPESRYVEAHKGRMWYGGVFSENGVHAPDNVHPRRWWWSDPGLPDSVYQDVSYVDATDGESFSDATVGATGNFRDSFIIWLERSIWVVSGTGQTIGPIVDYKLSRSNAKIGTISHRTVIRIPAGSKFTDERSREATTNAVTLAYLTPLGDIRLFDGDNDTIISTPKKRQLAKLSYTNRRLAFVVEDIARGEVTWVFPVDLPPTIGHAPTAWHAITWNYRFGIWYDRPLWGGPFACACIDESEDSAAIMVAGSSTRDIGGVVFGLWETCTADEASYPARWMSKTIYFPGMGGKNEIGADGTELLTHEKRIRWVDLLFEVLGTVQLKVEWLRAEAKDDEQALGFAIVSAGGATISNADGSEEPITDVAGNPIVINQTPAIVRARFQDDDGRYLHGRGFRFRVTAVVPA